MAGNDAKPAEAAARPSTGKTARIRLEKHMRPNSKHPRFAGKFFHYGFPDAGRVIVRKGQILNVFLAFSI
jgi:hypothetical protein